MKKNNMFAVVICCLLALTAVSCTPKQRPTGGGINLGDQGKLPGKVDLKEFSAVRNALTEIKGNLINDNGASWQNESIAKDFNELSEGYIVINNNTDYWVVLGIKSDGNVSLGFASSLEEHQKALDAARERTNLDPRKLVFHKDGITLNPLSIAWAGRAGKSTERPDTAVDPYIGYDKEYGHIIPENPYGKTFKILSTYRVTGFDQSVIQRESEGLGQTVVSYIYETEDSAVGSADGRKAWFWIGDQFDPAGSETKKYAKILKGEGLRFGYGTEPTDYPTQEGGENNKGPKLRKLGKDATQNNSAPVGKAFFYRTDKGDNIYFLTTMVAYNIRMRAPNNTALKEFAANDGDGQVEGESVKEGIMEFDAESFKDAKLDHFDKNMDLLGGDSDNGPSVDDPNKQTRKIPFVFFRAKAK